MDAWLARVVEEAGALPAVAQALRLCLHELVANVIQYGYPDGRAGRIAVTVAPEARRSMSRWRMTGSRSIRWLRRRRSP